MLNNNRPIIPRFNDTKILVNDGVNRK